MSYTVLLAPDVDETLAAMDDKSERICRDNLAYLEQPYPGRGPGDKEGIVFEGKEMYRLHIGRSYTAIYSILDDKNEVRVFELLDIDEAHKRYGF